MEFPCSSSHYALDQDLGDLSILLHSNHAAFISNDVILCAATVATLTDLGFLWFREFYLESSRVIQV